MPDDSGNDTQGAADGVGPLLQRDYWAVIAACRYTPSALIDVIADRFSQFAPEQLVRVSAEATDRCVDIGRTLDIVILFAGACRVRCVHRDRNSFTLATLPQHVEAGKITFGAYRDDRGDVVIHIRSRARAASVDALAAFIAAGEAMQTITWADFITRVAAYAGSGVAGAVRSETCKVDEEAADAADVAAPTFIAVGD